MPNGEISDQNPSKSSVPAQEIFDNVSRRIGEDIHAELSKEATLMVASPVFSIAAYGALQKSLESIKNAKFIFTSPAFTTSSAVLEKLPKARREFFIPQLSREEALINNECEIRLRNKLMQEAVAKSCAEWIRKKASFYSTNEESALMPFMEAKFSIYVRPVPAQGLPVLGKEGENIEKFKVPRNPAPGSVLFHQQPCRMGKQKAVMALYRTNATEGGMELTNISASFTAIHKSFYVFLVFEYVTDIQHQMQTDIEFINDSAIFKSLVSSVRFVDVMRPTPIPQFKKLVTIQ